MTEKTGTRYSFRYSGFYCPWEYQAKPLKELEARVGIEPTHKGLAGLSTTGPRN